MGLAFWLIIAAVLIFFLFIAVGSKPKKQHCGASIHLLLSFDKSLNQIGGIIMSLKFEKNQTATARLIVKDRFGNEAPFQRGSVTAKSQDESVATIEVDEDGNLTAKSVEVGATVFDISVDARVTDDGDPTTSDDVKTLELQVAVEVAASEGVSLGLDWQVTDNPAPQPE